MFERGFASARIELPKLEERRAAVNLGRELINVRGLGCKVRCTPNRWGNRPAILWIAEDFGCCASG